MDTLYIGDIPEEYHYAIFSDNHIDLYNTNILNNGTFQYYRIYTNLNGFYYDVRDTNVNQFQTIYASNINVSNDEVYRFDFPNILLMTLCFAIVGLWLLNLITSIINKGGVLSGLL